MTTPSAPVWDARRRKKIRAWAMAGLSARAMATKAGCTLHSIHGILHRMGEEDGMSLMAWTPEQDALLIKHIRSGARMTTTIRALARVGRRRTEGAVRQRRKMLRRSMEESGQT